MKVSVSILSDKYKASELIEKINKSNADYIHLDIMDGKFVKRKTWGFNEIQKLVKNSKKKLDVHLMVKNPIKYIEEYALLNTEFITFHYESAKNIDEVINKIKSVGIKVGISIKPETNLKEIMGFLAKIDMILVMSVSPGASGQSFLNGVVYKIEMLNKLREERKYNYVISVDGGINKETANLVKKQGADIVVSASYLHENLKRIDNLR